MADSKDTLMLPVISIIVPCYNQGKYLPEALESVLAQTYTNWECIIVNDGSTDDTEKIAQVYAEKDERIKYLHKENGGLSSARNAGIESAKGAWIQFLDSDDLLNNSKLQLSLNASQQHHSVDIIVSNFKLFVNNVSDTQEPYAPLSQECLSFEKLLYGWNTEFIIPIHSGFFKAELLKNNLFNETLKANEDWVMWLSIFKSKPNAIYIPNTYAYYRINPESMTKDPVFVHDCLVTAYKYITNHLAGEHSTTFSCMIIDRLNDTIKTRENRIQVLETTLVNKVIWKLKKLLQFN